MSVQKWNDTDAVEVRERSGVQKCVFGRVPSVDGDETPDGHTMETNGARDGRKDSPRNAKDLESPIA